MAMPLLLAALLMRVGVTLYTAGLSRSRNAASSAIRCIVELWIAILAFWVIGVNLITPHAERPIDIQIPVLLGILLVSGWIPSSLAERSPLRVVAILSVLFAGIIIPCLKLLPAHMSALHEVGGICWLFLPVGLVALVAAKVVGPRTEKYNRDGSTNGIPGHNLMITAAGFLLMLSAIIIASLDHPNIPLALLNILLAVSAGGLAGCAYWRIFFTRIDPVMAMSACLAGAIAASAGIDALSPWSIIVISAIVGFITPPIILAVELRLRIDDVAALGCVATIAGILGPILATLFITPGAVGSAIFHIALVAGIAVVATLIALSLLRLAALLRVTEESEHEGLDLAQHDLNAYPDFQQTMIKSYHLRER